MKHLKIALVGLFLMIATMSTVYAIFIFATSKSSTSALNLKVSGYSDIGELTSEVNVYQDDKEVPSFIVDNSTELAKNYATVKFMHRLPINSLYTQDDVDYQNALYEFSIHDDLVEYFDLVVTTVNPWEMINDENLYGATITFKVQLMFKDSKEPSNLSEYEALSNILEGLTLNNENLIHVTMTLQVIQND